MGCKTSYKELLFTSPPPPSDSVSYTDVIIYLKKNFPEKVAKAVFAIMFAEARKKNNQFISPGGHNYGGVQTDAGRWGSEGIIGQYCKIDSGNRSRAFAIFESDYTFLDFMVSRIEAKEIDGTDGDKWTRGYIDRWWSPKKKADYVKGTKTYDSKYNIYRSAMKRFNAVN